MAKKPKAPRPKKTAPIEKIPKVAPKTDVDAMLVAVLTAHTDEDDLIQSLHDKEIADAMRYLGKKGKIIILGESGDDVWAKAK